MRKRNPYGGMKPRDKEKVEALSRFIAGRVKEYVKFMPDGTIQIDLRNY